MTSLLVKLKGFRYHFITLLMAMSGYQTANTSIHNSGFNYPIDSSANYGNEEVFIKVLSWNVYMLPYLHLFHDTRSRAAAIGDKLRNSPYDLILFQETFHTPSRDILKEHLKGGYSYFYGPFNDPGISLLTNSGLFVASRIPLSLLGVMTFNKAESFDALAQKGAVLLEGIKDGFRFQVVTTHMQADQSAYYQQIRIKQMRQI
ncbi:MAG: hypothetical protein PHQ65_11335, partial [Bacteroidales bacterium]|nr:hypothetical protein [Bacteroidales bacterium]